ncbi:MAG: DUF2075 domain-containing protein [Elusimicrobiales bacterium]|nr:DUF2075 domain-containing protein [Elusimicrobiales bacterium]
MIVYSGTKERFQRDVMSNDIGNIIDNAFKGATGHSTPRNQITAWTNSLQYMDRVLGDDAIPNDAGVAIEYHIPRSSKRIDFILTGTDAAGAETAVLIELKQWQQAGLTTKDAVVTTVLGGAPQETAHPSYQAWTYKCLLQDYNRTVQEERVALVPCAYLHNYEPDDVITSPFYDRYTKEAPVFLKPDAVKLRDFIKRNIKQGDRNKLLYRIDHGKIKPSKSLADSLASMLKGNREFVMVDDQKIVYETALALAATAATGTKQVLIVEGGPGTGKSVVAVNLLVELTRKDLVAQYVTRNSAPRLVYAARLAGTLRRNRIDNMFRSSETFHAAPANEYDCLLVDEAHRLKEKSGMFDHLGENQVKELINAARLSVFFIDEDQKVTLKDIGEKDEIRRWAKKHAARVTELKLESQFRCNGSDGYLAWLDNALQVGRTANETLDTRDYDFQVIDDPARLHALIRDRNGGNKARMVAGYCWKWISKRDPKLKDIVIGDYKATWNLDKDGQTWIIQPGSVGEVGCIHTCQGLELDYVGVIVGPDLVVRDGEVITSPAARAGTDRSLHGWRALHKHDPAAATKRLDLLIKNTYRTLMTRGQKGCYVYFTDKETADYFKSLLRPAAQPAPLAEQLKKVLEILTDIPAARKWADHLPVYSLEAACGAFGRGMAVEPQGWAKCPPGLKPDRNMFIARVSGRSMEPKLHDGDYCVFRANVAGTRQGKIVLVQHSSISDPDTGGSYTVKKYTSKKKYAPDGTWQHEEIVLKPLNPEYDDIVIPNAEDEEFMVVAEVRVVVRG